MSPPSEDRLRYIVEAADAALQVLFLIGNKPDMKLAEIAQKSGFNKSRTMRMLVTLENRRLASRDEEGRWRLGLDMLILGRLAEKQLDIARSVQPYLDALRDATGETAQYRILSGLESLCIAKADSPHSIRIHAEIGRPRELYIGSAKVLLAFADEGVVRAVIAKGLTAFTPNTAASPEALQAELASIRGRGYSISLGERIDGALALGAPVRNSEGKVLSSVSLSGPEVRMRDNVERHVEALTATAEKLSKMFGWPGN